MLGPALRLCWVRMEGIPQHAWTETTFRRLGDCVGQVVKIDEDALLRHQVDVLRVQVLRDLHVGDPQLIALDVDGVRFFIVVSVEEMVKSLKLQETRPSVIAQSKKEGEGAQQASIVQPESRCPVSLQSADHF